MAIKNLFSQKICILFLCGCVLVACSSTPDEPESEPEVTELYEQAEQALSANEPQRAAALFDDVERLYPYSQWAKRAMIMSAFSYYEAAEYEQAAQAAQRYLDFYPSDEDSAYAQYLIGLSYYDQITDTGRDQSITRQAAQELLEVIRRYPETEYAREAQLKYDLTQDHLAGKEMEIGRYYLKRGQFTAAINRFRSVVEDYQTTTHIEEALHRLVEAYLALGVVPEAQTAAAILGHNFPGSDWYADSYALLTGENITPEASGNSWLNDIYRRVIKGDWL